ncbi:hypothetical protein Rhopal_000589-T1 [Rhodotorula paludigena]|uniref:Prefoldin subunit 6 n=1 Tax=Rhodotorula paludigena TaxID=86838 RepID=A0AAV5GE65_9BASI|nr:hypothetical protein Rhopal_000589-T1 [Rhodotorula paludigena]
MSSAAALEAKLQATSGAFTKLENDYARAVEELANLKPENTVYKQVGPVLLKQDQDEARGNVDKRLEWIEGEIKRTEANLKDLETKLESKKMEGQYQQQLQAAGAAPVAA